MITLTEKARAGIADFLKNKPQAPIRIYPQKNHAGGIALALALDTIHEDTDEVMELDGFTFCMNGDLKRMVQHVTIDRGTMGFVCTPLVPLPDLKKAGSGCSPAGCTGSCSSCH